MRIFILLCFLSVSTFASQIDWTRLNMEMEYLSSSTSNSSSQVKTGKNKDPEQNTKELKFQRKSPLKQKGIANLDSLFDSVELRQAAPTKDEDQDFTREFDQDNSKSIHPTGSLPSNLLEK